MDKLKRIVLLTWPLLLMGAAKALAATSGLPPDGPVTTSPISFLPMWRMDWWAWTLPQSLGIA